MFRVLGAGVGLVFSEEEVVFSMFSEFNEVVLGGGVGFWGFFATGGGVFLVVVVLEDDKFVVFSGLWTWAFTVILEDELVNLVTSE